MDQTHIDAMRYYFKNLPERTFRVLDMSDLDRKVVFDPYGGDLDEYLECRDDIVTAIDGILKYLQNETKI
jgi:protein-tyrosine-phosphatase